MESYQTWFAEGPELSVLRMLGLFDRPADEKAVAALLRPAAIPGLTESLTDLSPTEWRTILAKLRRARLLAGEDAHHPGQLDTHPLVREYFGEQLRSQQRDAWKECNRPPEGCFGIDSAIAPYRLEMNSLRLGMEDWRERIPLPFSFLPANAKVRLTEKLVGRMHSRSKFDQ
jgi:hypothetical protein